ncbi:MAG: hypothetical protein LBL97_01975 [Prevotellaceae bacterium]|jgi:hypothetical protein|nr:hypothetical protein [Prevotellaceae bacterium]
MKNLLWMVVALVLVSFSFTFTLTSCGNKKESGEALRMDSFRRADSLAAIAQIAYNDSIALEDSIKTAGKQ